jgi:queuine/archaeosine tRNA-ribosyltransferase
MDQHLSNTRNYNYIKLVSEHEKQVYIRYKTKTRHQINTKTIFSFIPLFLHTSSKHTILIELFVIYQRFYFI